MSPGGRAPAPSRELPVEPVGGHGHGKQGRCPVVVVREVPLKRRTTKEAAAARATVNQSATAMGGENTRVSAVPKILVANRGEIAIRIFHAARAGDRRCRSTRSPTDASTFRSRPRHLLLGPGAPTESYLNQGQILEAAQRAAPSHPSRYGFLAENAGFARPAKAGLTWIGPPPEAIEAMGSKVAARETMRAAGVPIVPGTTGRAPRSRRPWATSSRPLAIKASAEVEERASRSFVGLATRSAPSKPPGARARRTLDPAVYVERYLEDPRHVEVQSTGRRAGQRHSPRRARLPSSGATRSWSRRRLRLRIPTLLFVSA